MENSVTLTLARYYDLIDIERDLEKEVNKRMKNLDHANYVMKNISLDCRNGIIENLRDDNSLLKNKNKSLRENVRAWKCLFYVACFWIIILMITIYSFL